MKRMKSRACMLWLVLMACLAATGANAANFCVSTPAELSAALSTAASNGQDDVIQVVQGTYLGVFAYTAAAMETYGLTIAGGYVTGCVSQTVNPLNTVLDAQAAGVALALDGGVSLPNLTVDGLSLRNGSKGLAVTNATTVTLTNLAGSNNTGAAVEVTNSANLTLTGSVLNANAYGLYVTSVSGLVTLRNNIFSDNTTAGNGGGCYLSMTGGTALLTGNTIIRNAAAAGGGVYVTGPVSVTLDSNLISANTASNNSAGVFADGTTTLSATNNVIARNTSTTGPGGGIGVTLVTKTTLTNNTLTGNQANTGGGLWLRLVNVAHAADIYNNIIWGNTATGVGADVYLENTVAAVVTLKNNDVAGFSSTPTVTLDVTNQNNAPLFQDAANGIYNLTNTSPCYEAGDNAAPARPTLDILGNSRIIGAKVDLGAYEYTGQPLTPSQLQFESAAYTVNETAGLATITVTRTGGSAGVVTAACAASDGTAIAGTDYRATATLLNFLNGQLTATFTVPIINVLPIGTSRTFNLALSNPTGGATLGTSAATVTIQDQSPILTVAKLGDGTGNVASSPDTNIACGTDCTTTTATYAQQASTTLTATADAGSIFTGWSGDTTCAATNPCAVTLDASKTITATFKLAGALQFEKAAYTVFGNLSSVTLKVTRTNGSAGNVGVTYATSDGTAMAAADYVSATNQVLLADTVASGTFDVRILPRPVKEGDKTFELTLSTPTGGATLGTQTMAAVTIQDWIRAALTVTKLGAGTGAITGAPDANAPGLTCGATVLTPCVATYDQSPAVMLTATPAAGAWFAGWAVLGFTYPGTAPLVVTMDADKLVYATFSVCGAGDLNCDGAYNVLDLQSLINCIFGTGDCTRADLNNDLSYNILDVQQLINKIFN